MEDILIHMGYYDDDDVIKYTICNGYIEITIITLDIFQSDEIFISLMQKMKKIKLTEKTQFLYHHLPNYITHLSIYDSDDKGKSNPDIQYNNLHNGLKCLIIESNDAFTKSLDNLPLTLETLLISSDKTIDTSLAFLPVSLKHLGIRSRNKCNFDNLPSGLETLFIAGYLHDVYVLDDLNNLPENLKIFNCSISCITSEDFWNNIRRKLSARYPNLTIQIKY